MSEEMARTEAIEVLKDIISKPMLYSNHIIGACRVALASLETDEAYQLEYELMTKKDIGVDYINGLDDFIEFGKKAFGVELAIRKSDNPDTYEKLFGTTKNDLAVEKTDMIDKSNFSQEQYKTDLQSAYDCGYEQAKNDLGVELIDRVELLKAADTWDKFGYTTRYGLERLDKDDKGFVPYVKYDDMVNCVKGMSSVTPIRPKGHWIKQNDDYYDWYECSECGYGSEGEMQYSSEYDVRTNYCPSCGAKMVEPQESEDKYDDTKRDS